MWLYNICFITLNGYSILFTLSGCIATVATPLLISGRKYNQSDAVQVGSCDHGPLEFVVLNGSYDGKSQMVKTLSGHTHTDTSSLLSPVRSCPAPFIPLLPSVFPSNLHCLSSLSLSPSCFT